jgi:two-component system cell cycle response regulator
LQVTISVGLALSGHPQRAPEPLVHSADLALYAAKDKGRNTVVLADTVTPLVPPDRGHDSATAKRPRRQQRKA